MIRTAAAAAALCVLVFAGNAAAQTYGQPVYLNAYGRPVGGTPLSEVETRAYVETGRWADGYSDRPLVVIPAPGYDRGYGYGYRRQDDRRYAGHGYSQRRYAGHGYSQRRYSGYGHNRRRTGHNSGYGYGYQRDYDPPSRPGYRDEWGYNDDRSPSARRWSGDRGEDVYLYDR